MIYVRLLIVIPFWFLWLNVSATNYYISSSGGNDSEDGMSESSAWKSLDKVNASMSVLQPGDRLLFKRGDVFFGSLNITKSGTIDRPITIGAYGSGARPLFTGSIRITGWRNEGGGIYSKTIETEAPVRMVTFNGKNTPMGRWPNAGWITYDSYSGSTQLTDALLASSQNNWTGAEVVIRINHYTVNYRPITAHSGTSITFASTVFSLGKEDKLWGFYIQNSLRTLDVIGEWFFNPANSTFYMYFGNTNPVDYEVDVATIEDAITITKNRSIVVDNIAFMGYNDNAFELNACPDLAIHNCDISFCGGSGVSGTGSASSGTSEGFVFSNNSVSEVNDCGIRLLNSNNEMQFVNATISDNKLENIGLNPGAGQPWSIFSRYGILMHMTSADNDYTIIESNSIRNAGYIGIGFQLTNVTVRNNIVDGFCLVLADGGGIYSYNNTGSTRHGYVHHNIVLNGYGQLDGTPHTSASIAGLYSDGHSNGLKWEHNSVANCSRNGSYGYLGNGNDNGTIKNNTFYNNDKQIYIKGATTHENCEITGNIFFAKETSQKAFYYYDASSPLVSSCKTDYNYYARPIDNDADGLIINWYGGAYNYYTLAEWRNHRGQDANSIGSPFSINTTSKLRFEYNGTAETKTVALDVPYVDVQGTKYHNSLSLPPYESRILIVDPNPSDIPVIPGLVSAVIENLAPSKLEMYYSLSLANIIPANSAFTVMVNSSPISVTSVSISGSTVTLTLESAVYEGDKVTVSYNKPSSNPLQTTSGGLAETILNREVTNNSQLRINQSPTVSISSPVDGSSYVAPASITINAVATDPDGTISRVEFFNGSVKLGELTQPPYSFSWTNVSQGTYTLTAKATDNQQKSTFSNPVAVNVDNESITNQPPTVSISSPTKSTTYVAPATITIDAVANDPDGTISRVEFFNGNIKLGESTLAPYSITWKNVSAGTYTITAKAFDDQQKSNISDPVTVEVASATVVNQVPVVNIVSPRKDKKHKKNDDIVIVAEATDPDGEINSVTLKNGITPIAELTSPPFVFVLENADTGSYSITAIATDNLGAVSSSDVLFFEVEEVVEYDADWVTLYPNPNNGIFTVEIANPYDLEEMILSIVSSTGKITHKEFIHKGEIMRQLAVTELPGGAYILMISGDNRILATKKFIRL